jgi:hypothetical protein
MTLTRNIGDLAPGLGASAGTKQQDGEKTDHEVDLGGKISGVAGLHGVRRMPVPIYFLSRSHINRFSYSFAYM